MWLGKLFGARKRDAKIDLDEEPARFSAPIAAEVTDEQQNLKRRTQDAAPAANGFDPYNSGTFKRKNNAWERVTKR